jgi:hypothetical protein
MVLRHDSPGLRTSVSARPHCGRSAVLSLLQAPLGEAPGKEGNHRVMLSGTLRCHP